MNEQTSKSEYLLLFRGSEWYNGLSAEQLQQVMGECKAWFDRLAEQGKLKAGQPLVREGVIVSGKNGRSVADGPFAESKEAIGGYLLLQVDSIAEAIAIAKTNPVLAYGTSIEVRPVAEHCPLDARVRQIAREEQLANA
ncbi:MAG TPA: YciI family protein [Verrucomicrobiae bacterium]|nr:YciI family protein [Verrucomicrobiae bacterium]